MDVTPAVTEPPKSKLSTIKDEELENLPKEELIQLLKESKKETIRKSFQLNSIDQTNRT